MDVTLNGRTLAVECKRMEVGEYSERERARMRELWKASALFLAKEASDHILQCAFLRAHRHRARRLPDRQDQGLDRFDRCRAAVG